MLDAQRQAFGVERVAGYGLAKLGADAGELAEDHRTAAVARVLDSDVLLSNEVHAVDERREEHHVGDGIVRGELLRGQRSMQVVDGNVQARLGEPAVDPADMPLNRGAQAAVLIHVVPAGYGDLKERDLGAQVLASLEKCLHGKQPFDNPLGVVEPVDAEQQGPALELGRYAGYLGGRRRV